MIREKINIIDDRTVMKIYHSCGEENELGEFQLVAVRMMNLVQ